MENDCIRYDVGYQKLERVNVCTSAVRIRITDSRACPVLSFVVIY